MTTTQTKPVAASKEKRAAIPKVRMACPNGRPIQLRYFCPTEQREVRVTTGTHDRDEAAGLKKDLEAKLRLGIAPETKRKLQAGPSMLWEDFREQYSRQRLGRLRRSSAATAESRLDTVERIVKPRTLRDMVDFEALDRLQGAMLRGEGLPVKAKKADDGKNPRERSPHTVKSMMASLLAALNWAERRQWVQHVPKVEKIETSKIRAMKGRAITGEEFERMLEAVPKVVGDEAAPSYCYVLRGLWTSALRLDELMHVSWDDANKIIPKWPPRRHPVLKIPAALQKNETEEEIPLLPWFEAVLLETPHAERTGWAFNPQSLQPKLGRPVRHGRPDADWVGKVISRIGRKAGIVVHPGDEAKGRPAKFASSHDLRRSCGDRLEEAGVPESVITRIMRHASWETTRRHYVAGDVQRDAGRLKSLLTVPGYNEAVELT